VCVCVCVQVLKEWCYGDTTPSLTAENAFEALYAARKYMLGGLSAQCVACIKHSVGKDNALDLYWKALRMAGDNEALVDACR